MRSFIRRFSGCEQGVAAIEYALIAALVLVGIIAALAGIGDQLVTPFETVEEELTSANAN
jgi:pilus assembly protein Flp/PilA